MDIVRDLVINKISEINGCASTDYNLNESLAQCNIDSLQSAELEDHVCEILGVEADNTVFQSKTLDDYIKNTYQKTLNKK